jgi:hypothetical protein
MKPQPPKKPRPDQPAPNRRPGARSKPPDNLRRDGELLSLQKFGGDRFAFVSPVCAVDRREDIAEVREIIAGEEFDIARDELLYLVSDCRGFLEAHNLLGELALEDNDVKLAKGHFGFGYETGLGLLPPGGIIQLPANLGDNRHFFAAGRGLARCLIALSKRSDGREVLQKLARYDPHEKGTQALLKQLRALDAHGGKGLSLPILNESDLMPPPPDEGAR